MKSNKQRAGEIKRERTLAREDAAQQAVKDFEHKIASRNEEHRSQREAARLLVDKKFWVNTDHLRPTNSLGVPEFVDRGYYVDIPFTCKSCGADRVWSATQQKWWYELAQGDVWTTATLCNPCRGIERDRKRQARQVHLAGIRARARQRIP